MVYVHERPGAYAFWTMDNTANDAWGNNNGTINGTITFSSTTPPTFLTQSYNYGQYSVHNNNTANFIAISEAPIPFETQTFTIHGWVKTSGGSDQNIMQNWRNDGGWYGWHLRSVGSTSKLQFEYAYGGGSVGDVNSSGNIATGAWKHFVVAIDASYATIWIDFVYDSATAINTIRHTSSTYYPAIGVRRDTGTSGSNDPFNGNIKDLAVVSRTFNAGDVKRLRAYTLGKLAFA